MNTLMIATDQAVYEIDCNAEIEVPLDGKQYHVADAIEVAALKSMRSEKRAMLENGKNYVVKVLAVVTEIIE